MYFPLKAYVAVAIALSLWLSGVSLSTPLRVVAATQEGTSAADCLVTPRDFEEIAILASTPAPVPRTVTFDVPATDVVITSIAKTVERAVACANANDLLRSLALFTDRYVAERFGAEHPDDLGSIEAALSRTPVPASDDDKLTIVAISEEMSNEDNWATAIVMTANRDGQFTDRLVFELVGDQWLIDSWTAIEESTGTPTA